MDANPTPMRDNLHLVLASEHIHVEQVVDETQAFVSAHTDDEDLTFRVVLLASEAFTNAIEHGNQLDPAKNVTVDVTVYEDRIEVSVEDQGEGFDPEGVRNPLAEENLLREGGRGLYFIERMADKVSYEEGGRKICFLFHRTD